MRPVTRGDMLAGVLLTIMTGGCSDSTSPGDSRDVFRQVSVGAARVCAVVETGRGYCWGRTFDFVGSDSVPTAFGGNWRFRQLRAAGGPFGSYACGLTGSATVCQGYVTVNTDMGVPISQEPAELENDVLMATLGAGDTHFCGLDPTGAAWCWGDLNEGVRGTGQPESDWSLQPNAVAGGLTFTSIGAGSLHTCGGTADGGVYCWGVGAYLGAPSAAIDSSTDTCFLIAPCAHGPVRTELTATAREVVAGESASCAITDAAELWCWGDPFDGSPPGGAPRHVAIPGAVASVALGQSHACALTTEGLVYCYGKNDAGQLGVEIFPGYQDTPVLAANGRRFAAISAGGSTTCGLTDGGVLYCWGNNESGQLGVGSRESSAFPLRVLLPDAS